MYIKQNNNKTDCLLTLLYVLPNPRSSFLES
jgi:hypothetical protein